MTSKAGLLQFIMQDLLDALEMAHNGADVGFTVNLHPRSREDFRALIRTVDYYDGRKLYQTNHRIENRPGEMSRFDTCYTRITMTCADEYTNITVFWPSADYTGVTP